MKVLESCVCSTILYNCESWGNANLTQLEDKYTAIIKYMLGVSKKMCNEFAYIELGIMRLQARVKKRQYRFYKNAVNERDWPLIRHIVRQSRDVKTQFINHYDQLLLTYNNEEEILQEEIETQKSKIKEKARLNK